MPDRIDIFARRTCLALAALLALRVVLALFRKDPLARIEIPALPTLAAATNSAAPHPPAGGPVAGLGAPTNSNAHGGTNRPSSNHLQAVVAKGATNAAVATNKPAVAKASSPATNSPAPVAMMAGMPPGMPPGMPMGMMSRMMPGGGPGGPPPPPLDPWVKARVDRIVQSELFGPVPRPLPMALLGIAGRDAFLRTPGGQSGVVREGAELGGIKLLRIGVNRVLVEENGTPKELTIFNGAGGESLLPKPISPQP
ncbi:MAG: hypothetical protein DVB31_09975 [Verrucomicrobia bacterium]|nr:MAG: hypothetical protein DVB31_09975 [Verrucomicrobiota bacterium]